MPCAIPSSPRRRGLPPLDAAGRRTAGAVKVERPTGRATLTAPRTGAGWSAGEEAKGGSTQGHHLAESVVGTVWRARTPSLISVPGAWRRRHDGRWGDPRAEGAAARSLVVDPGSWATGTVE